MAVVILICQFFFSKIQFICLAQNIETDQSVSSNSEEIKNNSTEPTELDLGDYVEEMVVGEKQLLAVTVLPENATYQEILYYSSNEKVATINGMGRITAKSSGTTKISVKCNKIIAKFMLNVIDKKEVTGIEVEDYEDELEVGQTLALSATVLPIDSVDEKITYVSSNPEIATVNSSGVVKGISPGIVTIVLKAGDITKNVVLTVKVATKEIRINSTYII